MPNKYDPTKNPDELVGDTGITRQAFNDMIANTQMSNNGNQSSWGMWDNDAYRQDALNRGKVPWPSTGTRVYEDASWEPLSQVQRPLGSLLNNPNVNRDSERYMYPMANRPNRYGNPGNREMFNQFSGGKMAPGVDQRILAELVQFMQDPEFIMEGMLKRMKANKSNNK